MNDREEAEITAWLAARSERVVETACARVFLAPSAALKLKRRVDLGYVDFTTAERRRWALERELAFNRETAPDIYRGLRRITRETDGSLALEGRGQCVELALEMRRFADDALLAANPEKVDGATAEALGRAIAGFHATAPLKREASWRGMEFTAGSNAELLRGLVDELGAEPVEQLVALTEAELDRQEPLLKRRAEEGFVRRCHGDLHLGNLLVEDDRPILFDCIEFSDLLSDIDVEYDLAFLLMDLVFRGRDEAAARVLAAYLDEAARGAPESLWDGLAALPLMLSMRAGVRAHVQAHSGDGQGARAYVAAAIAHLAPAPPVLAAVGGFSGVGKTTFARRIAPGLGASPGAVVLRTDEIRKRLHGVAATALLPEAAYTSESQIRVYETMFAEAGRLLAAGRAVVLDATFVEPALRARAEALARAAGVPFRGAWLEAKADVLAARIGARAGDASDATLATLRMQLMRDLGPLAWPRCDASTDVVAAADEWLAQPA